MSSTFAPTKEQGKSSPAFKAGAASQHKAWVAKAAKEHFSLETIDLGPLQAEEVEIAVEYCGVCHSDVSVLNNDWGISQFPATLGHEAIGRITALGSHAKGLKVGQ